MVTIIFPVSLETLGRSVSMRLPSIREEARYSVTALQHATFERPLMRGIVLNALEREHVTSLDLTMIGSARNTQEL